MILPFSLGRSAVVVGALTCAPSLAQSVDFDTTEDIAASFAQAELVELGDMDNDGDLDAVAYSASTGNIVWFENKLDSSGDWGAAATIATLTGTSQMQLVDVTGDGDLDVAAISSTQKKLEYYENPQVGGGGWVTNAVAGGAATHTIGTAEGFAAADFDGDADTMDFVIGDDPGVFMVEDATGAGTEISGYPTLSLGPKKFVAADVDGVGGMDVFFTATFSSGSLIAIMNSGSPSFATAYRVDSSMSGADQLVAANLDGVAGDEVLVCVPGFGRIDMYLNDGAGALNTFATYSMSGLSGELGVAVGDINGDGYLDVLGAESSGNVKYCLNLGDGTLLLPVVLSSSAGSSASVAGGDLDGDGDVDVIAGDGSTIQIQQNESILGIDVTCAQPGGDLSASGSDLVASNTVTLNLTGAQSGQMGYFINSYMGVNSPGTPITPGGDVSGQICIGGTGVIYGRHTRQTELFTTDGSGAASLTLDLTDIPNPRNGIAWPDPGNNVTAVLAGETWYWQAWYRITGGSEFSDAIGVAFR